MAFPDFVGNFALLSHANGFKTFRYDTTDTVATVDGTGYINNDDDEQNLAVGDLVWVFEWTTAVRTGTINDVSLHVVMVVDSSTGDVDLSDDLLSASPVSGD